MRSTKAGRRSAGRAASQMCGSVVTLPGSTRQDEGLILHAEQEDARQWCIGELGAWITAR
jgi:hypothetical protein